jgi:hypothetical protein
MLENNPLKQYFRRPNMYFKLPSDGLYYKPGVINMTETRELPVYPMTAIDEMTVRTPDGLFNGTAVVDLIKSCIPNIIDPWQLNSVDLDSCLIAIKAAAKDGTMAIGSTCPSCEETTEYDINLLPMLSEIVPVDYSQPLKIRELTIKFRPLTYLETNKNGVNQMTIQRTLLSLDSYEDQEEKSKVMNDTLKKLNEMVIEIVADTVEYIKTDEVTVADKKFIIDFLNNCDKDTSNAIKNYSIELREKSELKPFHVTCPNCKHEYDQKIIMNATDFFD